MQANVDPAAYGRIWAAEYDELFENRDDVAAVVSMVNSLATGRDILEFGVGTGRLAAPLVAAGFSVTGVDASPEMLKLLRERSGTERLRIIEGDFTSVDAGESYDVVLIAFSTLFLVPSQSEQIACLANARRHLRTGGRVVLEAFVPDHSRWTRGQNVAIGKLGSEGVTLKLSVHDPVAQVISTQDVLFDRFGTTLRPNVLRYAWPAELDAMAQASGLQLVERASDWSGSRFTAASTSHVSVYERSKDSD